MVDCVCNDGSPCGVCGMGSAAPEPCPHGGTSECSTSSHLAKLGLGKYTLSNLFDLEGSSCRCGTSVQGLLDQNLPIVLVYILTMAARDQETLETFINDIQMQQKRQKADIAASIEARTAAQKKKEDIIKDTDDWKTKANVDRTGALRKDDGSNDCAKAIFAIFVALAAVVAILTFGATAVLIAAAVLVAVCSIVSMIAKAAISRHADMRQFEAVMGWINPAQLFTDAIVTAVCEIGEYNPNDEKIQRLRMGLLIAFNIIAAIALVVAGIAATILSGGTAAPLIAMAIVGIVTGIIQLVCSVLEYLQAEKELTLAQARFSLNKILALIEQIKMNLEMVNQDIDMLIEMFASKMSDVREEYEKAARILKEYNDTKRMVAQNIRS